MSEDYIKTNTYIITYNATSYHPDFYTRKFQPEFKVLFKHGTSVTF